MMLQDPLPRAIGNHRFLRGGGMALTVMVVDYRPARLGGYHDALAAGGPDAAVAAQDHRPAAALEAVPAELVGVAAARVRRAADHHLVDVARARPPVVRLPRAPPGREEQVVERPVPEHEAALGRVRVLEPRRRRVLGEMREVLRRAGRHLDGWVGQGYLEHCGIPESAGYLPTSPLLAR